MGRLGNYFCISKTIHSALSTSKDTKMMRNSMLLPLGLMCNSMSIQTSLQTSISGVATNHALKFQDFPRPMPNSIQSCNNTSLWSAMYNSISKTGTGGDKHETMAQVDWAVRGASIARERIPRTHTIKLVHDFFLPTTMLALAVTTLWRHGPTWDNVRKKLMEGVQTTVTFTLGPCYHISF